MSNEIPTIEPEVIPRPSSLQRDRSRSPAIRSNMEQLAFAGTSFLVWYLGVVGKVANPKGRSHELGRVNVRVTKADLSHVLNELEDEQIPLSTENLRYFKTVYREICLTTENQSRVLDSFWHSAFLSKNKLGMDLDELNEFQTNCFDAARKWGSLHLIWKQRPSELKKMQNKNIRLSDTGFFSEVDLHKIVCDGRNRLDCQNIQVGDFTLSGGWERAKISRSLFSGTRLGSREPELDRKKYLSQWIAWEKKLRETQIPDLQSERYDGFPDALKLQHEGLFLIGQKEHHQDFLCIDSASFHLCELEQVEFNATQKTIKNLSIVDSVLQGVAFTGNFENLSLRGIDAATHITFKDCTINGGTFEGIKISGLKTQNVTFKNVIFRDWEIDGATLDSVRFIGGQVSDWRCLNAIVCGDFRTETSSRKMILEDPIFEEGVKWIGTARNIHLKNAAHQLPGIDVSELRILRLIVENSAPIKFSGVLDSEKLIQDGRVLVFGDEKPEQMKKSDECVFHSTFFEGRSYWSAVLDDPKEIASEAKGNLARLQNDVSLELRESLLGIFEEEEKLLTWLHKNGYLPIGKSYLTQLLKFLRAFGEFQHPDFKNWAHDAIIKTETIADALQVVKDRLESKGYCYFESGCLEEQVSEIHKNLCATHHAALLSSPSFQFFLEEYQGEDFDFYNDAKSYLQKSLPHLIPIDIAWAQRLIRDHRDQASLLVTKSRRELIESESAKLEKIKALMDLFSEKTMAIENGQNLTPQERERQLQELEQFRESMLDSLLDSDEVGYEPSTSFGDEV